MPPACSPGTTPSCERSCPIPCRRGSASNATVPCFASPDTGTAAGIGYRDLGGIEGAELDELIARQVRVFADRNESFEWKLHGHDRPADLTERLLAHGFVPEDLETVVIAPVADVAGEVSLARRGVAARGDRADGSRSDRRDGGRDLARRSGRMARRQPRGRAGGRPGCDHDRRRRVGRASSSAPGGSDSCREPTSRRSGVGARSRNGVVAASIARWSPTVPTSPRRAGSATSRWTRRRRADRSWSAWASSRSRRPRRTSGHRCKRSP